MSYYRVLGLEDEPFSTSPDPIYFFESRNHKSVLANLMIDLRLKRGLSVVLGEVGTGKTTLGRKLIQMLRDREGFIFHLILDPSYPNEQVFLQDLIRTFNIELTISEPTIWDYKEALERYLFQKGTQEKKTVVLIIDEAQKMNRPCLEILRMLLNYETNAYKLLQVVLLSQIELMPTLVEMQNLLDRVSLKCVLEPLDQDETREMIDFRLRQAGYKSRYQIFLEDAIREIHRAARGYPRKTAMLCHRALKTLVMKNEEVINSKMIEDLVNQDVRAGWSTIPLQKSSYLN